jgi:RES domain-containing protein
MARSTKVDKAKQLNAAYRLLEHNMALAEAAQALSHQFDLSPRQAYRYLEQAAKLEAPVEVTEATIPITLKLAPSTVRLLRMQAARRGMTIGGVVTQALDAFVSALKRHG